jgi:RNA polymerase sigma factor (sigma-70 family)
MNNTNETTGVNFWSLFLTNEVTIKKCFATITRKNYPAYSAADREDRYSRMVLDFERTDVFGKFDPERGELFAYLYNQAFKFLGTYYRQERLHSKRILHSFGLDAETYTNAVNNTTDGFMKRSNPKPMVGCTTLRGKIEEKLSAREAEVLALLADDELNGKEIAEVIGMTDMGVSRIRSRIREKVASMGITVTG